MSGNVPADDVMQGSRFSGKVRLNRCASGLNILCTDYAAIMPLHYSQIAQISFAKAVQSELEGKSVLGRALIGGVLLGPLGAVVGGISGVGSNKKSFDGIYLKFWSIGSNRYEDLRLITIDNSAREFCEKIAKATAIFRDLHQY